MDIQDDKKSKLKKRPPNNWMVLLIASLILIGFYFVFNPQDKNIEKVDLSTFIEYVNNEEIDQIKIKDNKIFLTLKKDKNGNTIEKYAIKEEGQSVYEILKDVPEELKNPQNLKIEVIDTEGGSIWKDLLLSFLPFLLLIGFFVFMMRQAQNSNNQAMSFGKSRATLVDKETQRTTFKDVAGCKEAKEEMIEIVDFLKNPKKYNQMGAKIPKGVLLVGPPGTGKTLLARAVAGEANVPFFNISGSEFVEMFVGVGASRVRDLFKKAKKNGPCIVFIDEIDAVGRQRGAGLGGGHDEREQTLNQILTEMDGFEQGTNIIVMAATNRPDVLDPALLRPGRFDRRITVDIPDISDREAILKVHSKNKPLAANVDLNKISRQTPGFTGADLENLMNEAAILSARQDKKKVTMKELEEAIEKVLMGPERKSRRLSKEEKKITAYHEVGHAIVGHLLKKCDPVHKISIVSRGMALGVTWFMPEEEKHLYSESKFNDELASLLGGHVAEKLIFGEVTTGPSNDLERATKMARRMVTEYGMSSLGPTIYGEKNHEVFLGRDFGHTKNYSEEIASKIDLEVKKIVERAYTRAKEVLQNNLEKLKEIADKLIIKETLTREEFLLFFIEKTPIPAAVKDKLNK
ncbi:MAG: ATP-dependent zinc metalloprotease FtsH [Candidatus Peregrinibacteria bacterium GW2011_GWA2_33_10]|nr:MAG: ATP-dependent zinc metalloprotease FtsH [Candidatus Peregrinibacteria bacterium GW2011_GWA2_33_10]KKP38705.1 MAG: ATP-dependent metalloprotease FtsH, cell division protease FtsH [Candidatus Peregrinibacteria bacterium GW2011_GWC2_33_13]OGJ49307.1 MAG: cell division protein FtsH [Candidatus Peregrinibacteria bacterium RIFOXYA2_FULL_33_7]